MANTMTPIVDEQSGEITGFEFQQSHGAWTSDSQEYFENDQGEIQHHFADVEVDEGDNSFDFEDYLGDLMVVEPELHNMIAWLADEAEGMEDLADAWNASLEAEDLDSLYQLLEIIQASYPGSGEVLEAYQDEVEEIEEESDEPDLENWSVVVEDLAGQVPVDAEQADVWLDAALDSQEDNPCWSDVCARISDYHNGHMTYEEGLQHLFDRGWTNEDLVPIYNHLLTLI